MTELTPESIARRVEALEATLASSGPGRPAQDWRRVVGMFGDSESMREVDEQCLRTREVERLGARGN